MKKILILFLVFLVGIVAFAETSKLEIQAALDLNAVDNDFTLSGIALEAFETTYFTEEERYSAPFLRISLGVSKTGMEGSELLGLSAGFYGGYSLGIGSVMRIDFAGGVRAFESSAIAYIIKRAAKEEYSISTFISPTLDVSAMFGLETISVRAGVKGSYQISEELNNGFVFTPYVALSVSFLKILNII